MPPETLAHTTQIQLLTAQHIDRLFAFEIRNRLFFENCITPRPAAFYSLEGVQQHIHQLTAEYNMGVAFPAVLIRNNEIVGRINLKEIARAASTAEIGYRIDQAHQGKGLASLGVRHLMHIASSDYDLQQLTARVLHNNPASARVLENAGFINSGLSAHKEIIQRRLVGCDCWIKRFC